jgi:tetraacyldisaccharide 4'-kinase
MQLFIDCSSGMMSFSRSGIERRLTALWYGDSSLALLLQPFAYLYGAIVALRVRAYRSGLLRRERIPQPVIVVGNLTVGGTGKTPMVCWLVKKLSAEGYRPGIVSRGYGARTGREPLMVTAQTSVSAAGDEAFMMAARTGVPVCIGAERGAAARRLLAETDVNVVISDDGLQHYGLARDLEIVVIDGQRGLGNQRLLPAGPLREPVSRLKGADFKLINGGDDSIYGDEAMGFRFTLQPGNAIRLDASVRRDLEDFRNTRVWSVAGIGNPQRFSGMLEAHGLDPVIVDVPDHGVVSLQELREKEAMPILMTEKDAVKYPGTSVDDTWYVPVDVQMPAELEASILMRIRALFPDD